MPLSGYSSYSLPAIPPPSSFLHVSDLTVPVPAGYFLTKIFHPNVSKSGEICVNVLKKDWKPDLGIRHVLLVIRCLLIEPFPESALNEEAGKLLLDAYEDYAKHARLMTSIHALPVRRSAFTPPLPPPSALLASRCMPAYPHIWASSICAKGCL